MVSKNKNNKRIFIGIVLVIIVVIGVVLFGVLKKDKNTPTEEPSYKANNNENVIKDQTLGVYSFTNTSLNYQDGNSVLRVSVTNTSNKEETLSEFKIHVYDEKHNEIVTLTGFVGDKIGAGETKYIESSYADDLTNAYSIEYEVVK